MPFLKDQLYKWPFSRFGILLRSFLKDLDAAVSFFKDQSMFIAASCTPSLVSKKWSKILCLGATLRLNLVELTPGLTLAVRMLIFPTKSSELNVQWVFGFKNFAFSSKCWNVWCFITMLNKVRPFPRAQSERWLYRLKFFSPRSMAFSHSSFVKKTSASSNKWMRAAMWFTACNMAASCSCSRDTSSARTGAKAWRNHLVSEPFKSKWAKVLWGSLGLQTMLSRRFVTLWVIFFKTYSFCTASKIVPSFFSGGTFWETPTPS